MFKHPDEERFISLHIPPISGNFSMERMWDPDIQLTVSTHTEMRI